MRNLFRNDSFTVNRLLFISILRALGISAGTTTTTSLRTKHVSPVHSLAGATGTVSTAGTILQGWGGYGYWLGGSHGSRDGRCNRSWLGGSYGSCDRGRHGRWGRNDGIDGARYLVAFRHSTVTGRAKVVTTALKVTSSQVHTRSRRCERVTARATVRVADIAQSVLVHIFLLIVVHCGTVILPILPAVIVIVVITKVTETITIGIQTVVVGLVVRFWSKTIDTS